MLRRFLMIISILTVTVFLYGCTIKVQLVEPPAESNTVSTIQTEVTKSETTAVISSEESQTTTATSSEKSETTTATSSKESTSKTTTTSASSEESKTSSKKDIPIWKKVLFYINFVVYFVGTLMVGCTLTSEKE